MLSNILFKIEFILHAGCTSFFIEINASYWYVDCALYQSMKLVSLPEEVA